MTEKLVKGLFTDNTFKHFNINLQYKGSIFNFNNK